MLKITRKQFDEYVEYAKKEEEQVDKLIKEYSKASSKIPESIGLRRFTIKHLLLRLRMIGRESGEELFIDYKDYETLEGYKGYLVLDEVKPKKGK